MAAGCVVSDFEEIDLVDCRSFPGSHGIQYHRYVEN